LPIARQFIESLLWWLLSEQGFRHRAPGYSDMIYAASPVEIEQRRFALLRKWRLRCKAVADSLEEAGDRLFTFTRLPLS
jgi:hypothetical protein